MEIKIKKDLHIVDNLIWVLTVILQFSFVSQSLNEYGRYIFLGITFIVLCLLCYKYRLQLPLKLDIFIVMVLLFSVYCMFTAFFAENPGNAFQMGITIFEVLACVLVFYIYYNDNEIEKFFSTFMCSGYLLAAYVFVYFGFFKITQLLNTNTRLSSSDIGNSNSIGMTVAIAIVLSLYFVLEKRKYFLIIPSGVSMIIVAASGSRKALFLVLLCTAFFLLSNLFSKKNSNKVIPFLIVVCSIIVFIIVANKYNLFSLTNGRITDMFEQLLEGGEKDRSTMVRRKMITVGLEMFSQSPVVGNGMGNTGDIIAVSIGENLGYLHNNFVEVLAGGGIIGFVIYYSLYLIPLITIFRKKLYKTQDGKIILALIVCILIMDIGIVTYYSKITYFYFALFYVYTDKYRTKIKIGDLYL